MKFAKLAVATAALGLMTAPVAAQQAQAERASAPVSADANQMQGSAIWLAILAAAAVITGIVIVADDNDSSLSA